MSVPNDKLLLDYAMISMIEEQAMLEDPINKMVHKILTEKASNNIQPKTYKQWKKKKSYRQMY